MSVDQPETPPTRRRFLAVCGKSLLAVVGVVAAGLGVGALFPSVRRWAGISSGPSEFQPVCAVETLPLGKWKLVSLRTAQREWFNTVTQEHWVWVRREGDGPGAIRVLSPICPHNGCAVSWTGAPLVFLCPCHGGKFSAEGEYKSGPPRRSMDPLEFRVENGQLLVQWQEFKTGVAERISV
jgi:menaquinol-cytochrome c reductase iron-sulfur subunit